MSCSDFLDRFSEFRDGEVPPGEAEEFRKHLESCASCRRYASVLDRGVELLKEAPSPGLPTDFRDRLQYSIYSLEEERRRRRLTGGGTKTMAVVATAAVVSAVIWTPIGDLARQAEPAVELPPIVAQSPEVPLEGPRIPSLSDDRASTLVALPLAGQELWEESNALLYQHSPLYFRHREASLVRTGLR
jgi:anti-sigma factor RsiW